MYMEHLAIKSVVSLFSILGYSISKNTVYRYFKLFSVLVYHMRVVKNNLSFSSPVEVDETLIYKRTTNRFVLYTMKNRKKWKLMSLIFKHVNQGNIIFSDCFSAYVNNQRIPRLSYLDQIGYNHFPIDHSIGKFFF